MGNNRSTYVVKPGDTLWDIAERELNDGSRWREITRLDGGTYNEETAKQLQIGEKLYIPDKSSEGIGGGGTGGTFSSGIEPQNTNVPSGDTGNNITHKELLTFSNLTNLDWHFVDLKNIKIIYF